MKTPPSLRNIYKEMKEELGTPIPDNGYLMPWAEQGVLLLNAVLTVRAGEANSHKGKGWEKFTDAVIRAVADRPDPAVFVLWGNYAQKKLPLIDETRHVVVKGAHPSPLSAKKFFGSRPFTQINEAVAAQGHDADRLAHPGPGLTRRLRRAAVAPAWPAAHGGLRPTAAGPGRTSGAELAAITARSRPAPAPRIPRCRIARPDETGLAGGARPCRAVRATPEDSRRDGRRARWRSNRSRRRRTP